MNKDNEKLSRSCMCQDKNKIILPVDSVGLLVGVIIFIFVTVFGVGFWAGRCITLEQVTRQLECDHFSDGITASVYEHVVSGNESDTDAEGEGDAAVVIDASDSESDAETDSDSDADNAATDIRAAHIKTDESAGVSAWSGTSPETKKQRYFAELAGFKTADTARNFERRLTNKQIRVYTKKRSSRNAKGKVIEWYQVVTSPYDSLSEIQDIVDRVIREEHLISRIPILECPINVE